MREWITQAVKFGMVGVINTGVDYGIYFLLTYVVPYYVAKPISYCCGMLCSFLLNRRFTFRDRKAVTLKKGVRFVLVNLCALGVSLGVLTFCVEVLSMNDKIANFISIPFSLGVNFLGNKLLVFRDAEREAE